jgi:putative addiction module killer protein
MDTRQTPEFRSWLEGLRDERAVKKVRVRISRLQGGNYGDVKFFGSIGELRIDYGPGYRVYFAQRGLELVLLLCGGDKSRQSNDIEKAKRILESVV